MEFTLLWAVLTAVAAGWFALRWWNRDLPDRPFDMLLGAALAGLVVGRLWAMVSTGVNPIANPGDFIIIRGGVHTGTAAIGFLVTLAWMNRRDLRGVDAVTPAVLVALAGWHLGCIWRASCLGAQSDLPWAWAQTGSDVTRHPVEIYAALILLAGAWVISRLGSRAFLTAGAGLSVASVARLVTEPIRPSISGGPVGWYLAGLLVGLVTIILGVRIGGRIRTAPT